MTSRRITILIDDLDGGGADHTVEFGLDGIDYTIDLSERNADKLRQALEPYVANGTRVGRIGKRRAIPDGSTVKRRRQKRFIREWAAGQGYHISRRGRIPNAVVDAFHGQERETHPRLP